MSSKDVSRRLGDIVVNADRIERYIAGQDAAAFADSDIVLDATQRCLERITEAVVKIGPVEMAAILPDLPFERVRGLGNMLRHAYDDIDLAVLYGILKNEVPALRFAALRALED